MNLGSPRDVSHASEMKTKRAHLSTPSTRSTPLVPLAPSSAGLRNTAEQKQSAFAMEDPRGSASASLLKALHILTRDGQLNQDSRRKLKQVNHLIQLMTDPLRQCHLGKGPSALQPGHAQAHASPSIGSGPLVVVDHGCGKSYLGFMLHEQFSHSPDPLPLEIIGIETREPLVAHSKALAQELHFKGMEFLNISAKEAVTSEMLPARVDVVTALHACDTASDDAIEFALAKRAELVFLVPCCQAELAAKLKAGKAITLGKTPLAELWRHPLHTREMGSQLTNVLRCLYLESQGYKVSVTELVGWEHSMKNELITASFTGQFKRSAAQRLVALLEQFGLEGLCEVRYPRVQAQLERWGTKPAQEHTSAQNEQANERANEQANQQGVDALHAPRHAAEGHALGAAKALKSAV